MPRVHPALGRPPPPPCHTRASGGGAGRGGQAASLFAWLGVPEQCSPSHVPFAARILGLWHTRMRNAHCSRTSGHECATGPENGTERRIFSHFPALAWQEANRVWRSLGKGNRLWHILSGNLQHMHAQCHFLDVFRALGPCAGRAGKPRPRAAFVHRSSTTGARCGIAAMQL